MPTYSCTSKVPATVRVKILNLEVMLYCHFHIHLKNPQTPPPPSNETTLNTNSFLKLYQHYSCTVPFFTCRRLIKFIPAHKTVTLVLRKANVTDPSQATYNCLLCPCYHNHLLGIHEQLKETQACSSLRHTNNSAALLTHIANTAFAYGLCKHRLCLILAESPAVCFHSNPSLCQTLQ